MVFLTCPSPFRLGKDVILLRWSGLIHGIQIAALLLCSARIAEAENDKTQHRHGLDWRTALGNSHMQPPAHFGWSSVPDLLSWRRNRMAR